ncbi:hypothetical protein F511_29649 [Dorcoceras hygrometricum]|uniref:Uncharacterized protein n=1 Tax=Dorcoceras hygrometricum TaxID=472368 RepID=A0A2Z7DAI8_9LAMI|nr:hypothetical protein F511_29649 [Dorcoceras hygrometricum]
MGSNTSTESNYKTAVNSKNKMQMLCMQPGTTAEGYNQGRDPKKLNAQLNGICNRYVWPRYTTTIDWFSNPKAGLYNTQKLIPDVASKRCVPLNKTASHKPSSWSLTKTTTHNLRHPVAISRAKQPDASYRKPDASYSRVDHR